MGKKRDEEGYRIIKDLNIGSFQKIDGSKSENISNKVLDERETRKRLLKHANLVGCAGEMLKLFVKYDKLLKNCINDEERKDIGKCGVVEMYNLLGRGGKLYVDHQLVIDDEVNNGIIKLG